MASEDALIFKPTNRELLASLLVMVILLCHGAYGVNHPYVSDILIPHHSGEVGSQGSQATTSGGEQQEAGAEHISFLMALFSVLAAVLYLRQRGAPLPYATRLKLASGRWLPSLAPRLPQPTSPPVLQVFRL